MNKPSKEQMIKYVNDSVPYTEISKIYDVSDVTIKNWMQNFGIKLQKRKILSEEREKHFCLSCGKEINHRKKYCNNKCQQNYQYTKFIESWKKGENVDTVGAWQDTSNHIRKYMFEKYGNKCARCGWSEINPHSNTIPLELEHVDGNYANTNENNLTLLCPNCHSLTKCYKGANKGNGRNKRYKRSLK
jgi:predicted RNA-binding Zn-ribbon protein involved in translation (DUF1610 family)